MKGKAARRQANGRVKSSAVERKPLQQFAEKSNSWVRSPVAESKLDQVLSGMKAAGTAESPVAG